MTALLTPPNPLVPTVHPRLTHVEAQCGYVVVGGRRLEACKGREGDGEESTANAFLFFLFGADGGDGEKDN